MLRPSWWMKPWFASALRPGQGERTSLPLGGDQLWNLGSEMGAGPSPERRESMSGRSRSWAEAVVAVAARARSWVRIMPGAVVDGV